MVSNNDLSELRRLSTNTYDEEKALMNRVIRGINDLTNENLKLKAEVKILRENQK